ncbi:histone deacetylase [Hyphomicrobium sp. 2TAF46]|uniref:histone deacetylase n=1 Tax=Hyphomicrobium sp. 2TAF46 TaxID=3233019 RepID=UPI003F8EB83C
MALWSEGRSFDEAVRRTDNTLNVLVVVLLIAFAMCASAYYYGQMNPRVAPQAASAPAAAAQPSAMQPHP